MDKNLIVYPSVPGIFAQRSTALQRPSYGFVEILVNILAFYHDPIFDGRHGKKDALWIVNGLVNWLVMVKYFERNIDFKLSTISLISFVLALSQ